VNERSDRRAPHSSFVPSSGGSVQSNLPKRGRQTFPVALASAVTLLCTSSVAAPAPAPTGQADLGRLEGEVSHLTVEVERLVAEYPQVPDIASGGKLDEWFDLGQIALLSGNNADAALLFYGAVSGPGENPAAARNHPTYHDAVNGLGEALYNLGNYTTARFYYEQLLATDGHRYGENALLRLIEIASHMQDDDAIKRYYRIYQQTPRGATPSTVLYALGKSSFLAKKDDDARDALVQIQAGDRYAIRARYLLAALNVRAGKLDEALAGYTEIVTTMPPVAPEDDEVIELAHLARGRIYYEQDLLTEAVDAYQYIQIDSDYLSTMLYEVIWSYVRRGNDHMRDETLSTRERKKRLEAEYDLALERLRYLRYLEAGSDLEPDIAILMGNIQIQRGDYDDAELAFRDVLDVYGPADDEMRLMAKDPARRAKLLKDILLLEGGGLASESSLPPVAARRARENPRVAEALRIFKEIEQSKAEVRATRNILDKLEGALNAGDRTELFREVSGPLSRARNLGSALLKVEGQIVELKRQRALTKATPAEREEIERLAQTTKELESKMAQVTSTVEDLEARRARFDDRLRAVEGATARIRVELKGMRAQVQATDQMLATMNRSSSESPLEIANLRKELAFFNRQLEAHEETHRSLIDEASRVRTALKLSGGRGRSDEDIARAYDAAVSAENALLDRILGAEASQFAALLSRVRTQREKNAAFKSRIDAVVEERIVQIKNILDAERDNLAEYERRTEIVGGQAEIFRDRATSIALEHVRDVLNQIVVRADVGVVDVAWQRKQAETNKIGELQRAKAAELTDLNQAYADLTKDEVQ
jgi:tetratricopeptide (TPR) repeat protein